MRIKDIVLIGIMSAILLVIQVTLAFLPNIELISLLIIIYTLVFGKKAFYIIYVFVALEGLLYGIGLWWINYLYVWTILCVLVLLLRKQRSPYFWAILSGFYGLAFGALCAVPNLFLSGFASAVSYWIAGIPFDVLHGVGNFVVALLLFRPLFYLLDKVNYRVVY